MNIAFFNLNRFDYERGCEKQIAELAKSLSSAGHKVSLVGESYLYLDIRRRLENLIYVILGMPNRHNLKDKARIVRDYGAIRRGIMDISFHIPFSRRRRFVLGILRQADAVYVKNEFLDTAYLYYLLGAGDFKKKAIVGIHTAIFGYGKDNIHSKVHNRLYFSRFYGKLLNESRFIHTPNKAYISLLIERFGIDPEKIKYAPYVMEEAANELVQARADSYFNILFAGKLTRQKGVDFLCAVINNLSKCSFFTNLRFLVAGDGELGYMIEDLAKNLKNINLLGFVKDMDRLYRQVDVVLAPSRWEMLPYVCLEAQARGIPVISFAIPGTEDIIVDGETGYLVALGDVDAFCQRLMQLYTKKINSPEEFALMKAKSLSNIEANFSKDRCLDKISGLFNSILN